MGGNVAYWAHIGGFVAGIVLGIIIKRQRKPEPETPPPYTVIRV
jgi:membrane associated rhomboid family serine protease